MEIQQLKAYSALSDLLASSAFELKDLDPAFSIINNYLEKNESQNNSKLNQHQNLKYLESLSGSDKLRVYNELCDSGPLVSLINDHLVNEIIINSYDNIWYEKNGAFELCEYYFFNHSSYTNFINKLCIEAKIKFNYNIPFCDGLWGNFRVHLIDSPLTKSGAQVTLRRHKQESWNFEELKQNDWATDEDVRKLLKLVKNKNNFLIVGPTGSGKTSLINACLNSLPTNERVICIEDTDEIKLPNAISTKLLTRIDFEGKLENYSQADLLKQSLRMRPERIVVGEVRGGEAKDMLMALSTGHDGSFSSIHAIDARQALLRLEMLIQMGANEWSLSAIRQLIQLSLQYLVCLEFKEGKRKLKGIYRICSLENNGFTLEKV